MRYRRMGNKVLYGGFLILIERKLRITQSGQRIEQEWATLCLDTIGSSPIKAVNIRIGILI